jgi:hypothetical protein
LILKKLFPHQVPAGVEFTFSNEAAGENSNVLYAGVDRGNNIIYNFFDVKSCERDTFWQYPHSERRGRG